MNAIQTHVAEAVAESKAKTSVPCPPISEHRRIAARPPVPRPVPRPAPRRAESPPFAELASPESPESPDDGAKAALDAPRTEHRPSDEPPFIVADEVVDEEADEGELLDLGGEAMPPLTPGRTLRAKAWPPGMPLPGPPRLPSIGAEKGAALASYAPPPTTIWSLPDYAVRAICRPPELARKVVSKLGLARDARADGRLHDEATRDGELQAVARGLLMLLTSAAAGGTLVEVILHLL